MKRRFFSQFVIVSAALALAACSGAADQQTAPHTGESQSSATLATAEAFLMAAGSGDMETLSSLMAGDFVWHNEGDTTVPWIGTWKGKDTVLNTFLPAFGAGLQTTSWTTDYKFADDNQAVFIGTMSAVANETGINTGVFSWAVRVEVADGKVQSWNWFEDSYAVSVAYHGTSE
ncbi:MAG: nuclear transport factor 2 family protein [Pseudomonadota bacterium]